MRDRTNPSPAHYLAAFTGFGTVRNNIKFLGDNIHRVERRYRGRLFLCCLLHMGTAVAGLPFRITEKVWLSNRTLKPTLEHSPVFIVGHWRSGTTYLHQLLCQDKQWGFVTLFQTLANDLTLVGNHSIKPVLEKCIPHSRPTDNIRFTMDQPQEEEHAIARNSAYSFYHMCCFPKMARRYFQQYVLFDTIDPQLLTSWKAIYLRILKKAELNMHGRRLLLKNPVNTARIQTLLKIFPKARFIHIVRDPYATFASTRWQYHKTLQITKFQDISCDEIDNNILLFYQQMMTRFLKDRQQIPDKNLIELRYEDLESNPLPEIEKIYHALGLSGYHDAEPTFKSFIEHNADYRKNTYQLSKATMSRINQHWKFAFNAFGYKINPATPEYHSALDLQKLNCKLLYA